jgi:predicted O-methyltransferase YrrM
MAIDEYIHSFIRDNHPHLDKISRQELDFTGRINPNVGEQVGRMLSFLIQLTAAKHVLEFGSSLGYSTVFLAAALQDTGGKLISVELNPLLAEITRQNLAQAGLAEVGTVITADAQAAAKSLSGPFDLILQDSDKALYPQMIEDCARLLRVGGVLAADDTLFIPMGIPEKFSAPVHRHNQQIFADPRFYSTILPIGDGLTISVKINE